MVLMLIVKRILFCLALLLLFFPLLQLYLHVFRENDLHGYYRLKDKPDFSLITRKGWFSGEFQPDYAGRIEDHIGLRKSLFRVNNELDYRFFGLTHALGFIRGKGGNLFEEDYIQEYTGRFFIGKSTIEEKVRKLQRLQDTLASMGITLRVVLEPGKASIYPEYIPDHYNPERTTLTNYQYFKSCMDRSSVQYLDLNSWFVRIKDTTRYPLFPKYGMHWSMYGLALAMDTLTKYLSAGIKKPLPPFRIKNVEWSDTLRSYSDNDIGDLLNLIFPLPSARNAYPDFSIDTSTIRPSLKALVIADSYYNMTIQNHITDRLFREQEFWYYYSKVWPDIENDQNPVYIDKSKLADRIAKADIILLMVSEINQHCMFWGFIDEAYRAVFPKDPYTHVTDLQNRIRNEREWFRFMVKKADNNFMSLEQVISIDGDYLLANQFSQIESRTHEDSVHYMIWAIRNNPDYLRNLLGKARQYNMPLEKIIRGEAENCLLQKK